MKVCPARVPMDFPAFHPVVRQWFTAELGEPTAAQLRGWDAIRPGGTR